MPNPVTESPASHRPAPLRAVVLPFRPRTPPPRPTAPRVDIPMVPPAWTADRQRLRCLAGSGVAQRARVIVRRRAVGAPAADALEPYCELLLEYGHTITHVELLHVPYWVDRLTIALVQARRWAAAQTWLDRLIALPPRYTGEAAPTLRSRLLRRQARCRRHVRDGAGPTCHRPAEETPSSHAW